MPDLSDFPITRRYPPQNPDILQLYSFPTPNGVKASIMLEETGIPYEAHKVSLSDTTEPEFLSLNPNNKIPAILDPHGPEGKPLPLFESGAILIYLADKTGTLVPKDAGARYQTIQWLMFQMAGVGPMFGQIGFFHRFAGKDIEDPRPKQRYVDEARRLLGVIETRLDGRDWLMGDEYTIADLAVWPWIRTLNVFYEAGELLSLDEFPRALDMVARGEARPASQRGLNIPPREG